MPRRDSCCIARNVASSDRIRSVPHGHPMVCATTASAETRSATLERVHDKVRRLAIVARSASRSRSTGGTVMIDATDMSTPVTRGELRAELEQFEIRLEQKLEQLEIRLEIRLEKKLEQKLDQKLDQK